MAAQRNFANMCVTLIEKGAVVNAYCEFECKETIYVHLTINAVK